MSFSDQALLTVVVTSKGCSFSGEFLEHPSCRVFQSPSQLLVYYHFCILDSKWHCQDTTNKRKQL